MKTQQVKQQADSPFQTKAKNQGTYSSILQAYKDKTSQRQTTDEEELLQGKFETVQRMELDEEEPLQGKFETTQLASEEDELLQGKFETVQRMGIEEEEPVQGKFETAQLATEEEEPLQRQPNNTGLPDNLKSGIENLSGYSMDDVNVHYNSSQPATLQAHAYAQGTDIHVAPGQEKHLPHEAWHVVQQKQGRVKPTMQMKGTVPVNDDAGLEKEADVMGAKSLTSQTKKILHSTNAVQTKLVQLKTPENKTEKVELTRPNNEKFEFDQCYYGSVEYDKDEKLIAGSATSGEALWKDILMDDSQSATRLHVVNADWGGSGANDGGNLIPGTRSLNGHHKTAENAFKKLFDNGKAKHNCKYECTATSDYTHTGDFKIKDPKLEVIITKDDKKEDPIIVEPGSGDGMKII